LRIGVVSVGLPSHAKYAALRTTNAQPSFLVTAQVRPLKGAIGRLRRSTSQRVDGTGRRHKLLRRRTGTARAQKDRPGSCSSKLGRVGPRMQPGHGSDLSAGQP